MQHFRRLNAKLSRVGKLRNKITIQNTDITTDNHGGYTTKEVKFVTAFATITPKAGRQIFNESKVKEYKIHILTNL